MASFNPSFRGMGLASVVNILNGHTVTSFNPSFRGMGLARGELFVLAILQASVSIRLFAEWA